MSFNGSGTFVINSAGQPVVPGTVITTTAFNALTADLGVGLSTTICKDGQATTTAAIPFAVGVKTNTIAELTPASGVTISSALVYGGVTLTNAVTGTGKMVLDTSPTIVTPSMSSPTITTTATVNTRDGTSAQRTALTILNGNAAGTGSNYIATQMSDNVGTSPATILTNPRVSTLVQVSCSGGGDSFSDIVNCSTAAVAVMSSLNNSGAPPSRTYSVSGFSLKLAFASGSYSPNVLAFGADFRN